MGGTRRSRRLGLVVGGLGLLGAVPAILTASGIGNRWLLSGAIAAAAVTASVLVLWQGRYRAAAERDDEQTFAVEDGCLVLPDGRLPLVRDIASPLLLGVHKAQPPVRISGEMAPSRIIDEQVPAYVPRDADPELRERVAAGGFVLLIGDSTAGKSRAAFEAVSATVPQHLLIRPSSRSSLAAAVAQAAQARRCVLWLDDLENYFGSDGLSINQLARLITGHGHHRVIMATLRAAEKARLTTASGEDDVARQVITDIRQILDLADVITVPRIFSAAEKSRARARDWDPRIAAALEHADSYGIAEYLAAGPELLRDWDDARSSSSGPNARGAALVAAAVDIRRAGYISPIPRTIVDETHEYYLTDAEHIRTPRESPADAWVWAIRQRRATSALLQAEGTDKVEPFDYLVDALQRRSTPGSHVPERVVRAAIDGGNPADKDSLASTAYVQGRFSLAEYGFRHVWQARTADPGMGPDHPSTLDSRSNHALVLHALGKLEESEAENRAVLETRLRVLGTEHPSTLDSRSNRADDMRVLGRLEESEAENRAVLETRLRVLGAEHPSTLDSRTNLAAVLRVLGRLEESEAESRAVLETRMQVLGAEHPFTLTSRNNVALVLRDMGRLEESEAESRAVLETRMQVLGAEHPLTLISRYNLAAVMRASGQLEAAEAEIRNVLDSCIRVLGAEHPGTLASRCSLAAALRGMGRLKDAETEIRAVLEIRTRVLGDHHPDTQASRHDLAAVLSDLG